MVIITGLPAPQRQVISNYKDATVAFSYVENAIILPVNDTLNELVGAEQPKFYAKTVEGAEYWYDSAETSCLGGFSYTQPDTKQTSFFVAFTDNKIYKIEDGVAVMVRDVGSDGFAIEQLSAHQAGSFLDIVIGDETMSAQTYRYNPVISTTTLSLELAPGLTTGGSIVTAMEGRHLVFGTGLSSGNGQFSELDPTSVSLNFVSGDDNVDPGQLGGGLVDVRAALFFKGMAFVFEESRITVHQIGDPFTSGTDLVRDNSTIQDQYSVDGFGTSSMHGATIGRGAVFYVDKENGVFSYSVSGSGSQLRLGGEELSASIRETITRYDLSSAAIVFHPGEDILMVSCASAAGGANDTIFYYSFQTKGWSKDPTKYISQFLWNKEEEQMYGLSSLSGKIIKIFNGTYYDEYGDPIVVKVRSKYFEGGRRSQLKEYIDSSVIFGIPTATESILFSLFINSEVISQAETNIDVTDFTAPGMSVISNGTWGGTIMGGGAALNTGALGDAVNFVQYYNEDLVDDHRRIAIQIESEAKGALLIFAPEIVTEIVDETDDDFWQ